MMVPGAEHFREIANKLRETAAACQFAGDQREILHLAARFESRAEHLDHRVRSMTGTRLA
jgi:ABC-type Zn2+ transport system substrate-binding protein/surface adhesin